MIVVLTVFAALFNEANIKRKEVVARARRDGATVGDVTGGVRLPGFFTGNAAAVALVVFAIATIAVVGTATVYSPQQCIANVQEQKRLEIQQRIQELRDQRKRDAEAKAAEEPKDGAATAPKPSNNSGFGGVFAPGTLQGGEENSAPSEDGSSNNSGFGGVFDPGNIGGGSN